MLKIEGVSKQFRAGNFGVRNLSLDLPSGVIGLLGPNGAGKTTLMQMIADGDTADARRASGFSATIPARLHPHLFFGAERAGLSLGAAARERSRGS